MEDEEFNLDEYRKAWQAESRRIESAAPRHSEEEILSLLQRRNQPPASSRRQLYLWVGRAAAGVVLLLGIAWPLLRQSQPSPAPDTYVAQLPQSPAAIVAPSDTITPSPKTAPQPLTAPSSAHPAPLRASLSSNRPSSALLAKTAVPTRTVQPVIAGDGMADALPPTTPTTNPAPVASETAPNSQGLALHGQKESVLNDCSNTWKGLSDGVTHESTVSVSEGRWVGRRSFASSELTLSFGTCITPSTPPATSCVLFPAADLSLSLYSKTNGRVCGLSQFGVSGLFDQDNPWLQLHFGYGLAVRPIQSLTCGLNMGVCLTVVPMDLDLQMNVQASYRFADNFSVGLNYRYCTTGFRFDSRQVVFVSLSYLID